MTRLPLAFCALGGFVSVAGAQGFTDVTEASGLTAVRDERAADWWVSGLHFVDLDGDGALDVFLSSHGSYGALAALGDGSGHFTSVADGYPETEIHIPYDFDEDGRLDLSVTYQDGGGQIWLNAGSPGAVAFTATETTREGNTSRIQVMLDVDRDGKVDWVRASETEDGVIVDLGDGSGQFMQGASELPGLGNVNPIPVDLDGDGDKDWVTSWGDYRYEPGMANVYREDGELELVDVTADVGLYVDGFAIQGVGDYDQDGDSDLIAIEHESFPPSIYLNDGSGSFSQLTDAISGVPGQPNYPTWGLGVVTDLDNDGVADMLFGGRNYLLVLRGTGGGHFEYMNETWGIENTAEAAVDNGFAFGDIDGDGDLDLLGWREIYPDRYFNLYRNDAAAKHWLRVRPIGLEGNRGAAGAKIRIYAAGTDQLLWYEDVGIYCRQVQPGYGYHFAETERHFGLGDIDSVDVTVEFYPSHKLVRQDAVAADRTVQIGEDGEGVVIEPPANAGADAGVGSESDAGIGEAGGGSSAGGGGGAAGNAAGGSGGAGTAGTGGASAGQGGAGGSGAAQGSGSSGGCACGVTRTTTRPGSGLALLMACFVALLHLGRSSMNDVVMRFTLRLLLGLATAIGAGSLAACGDEDGEAAQASCSGEGCACDGDGDCSCIAGADCKTTCEGCSLSCSMDSKCNAEASGAVAVVCDDTSECKGNGGDGSTITCQDESHCNLKGGVDSTATCSGSADCKLNLGPGSSVSCRDSAHCEIKCEAGPCEVECASGANCAVNCGPDDTGTPGIQCDDGRVLCEREC